VEAIVLMGTGKHLGISLFIVLDKKKGVCLIKSMFLATLFIEHGFPELLGKVFLFLSVKQMCCMCQTLMSILIKERRAMWAFSMASSSHFFVKS